MKILNGLIPLSWLGDSLNTFKIKIKKLFLYRFKGAIIIMIKFRKL